MKSKKTKNTEHKQYDLHSHCKHELKHSEGSMLDSFGYSVAQELLKCTISSELKTRKHKFSNGQGQVADKLVITIDFNKAVVQPHSDFEEDFMRACALEIEQNVNGQFENY